MFYVRRSMQKAKLCRCQRQETRSLYHSHGRCMESREKENDRRTKNVSRVPENGKRRIGVAAIAASINKGTEYFNDLLRLHVDKKNAEIEMDKNTIKIKSCPNLASTGVRTQQRQHAK
ncbi:uncharacterized protein LOC123307279 [Coccinella septempunctata]|uniref:uncharacterized protein LOC123307279 n=1 Tax=Coccinella septempunctata TaxID=41139 RepID=UPI001D07DB43|nr:uncharacterized protein LOC123307279 [Coccinella septempunctata]